MPLAAADGTRGLILWFAPAAEAGQPTVLFLHGNAGEMADRSPAAGGPIAPRVWAAAFLEYRGYGGSDGTPTESGLHQDADAALDWLEMRGIAPARVAVVGESLGTGVAVRLAADRPVGALVLGAPFTSAADVAARAWPWLPVRLLMRDTYRIGRPHRPGAPRRCWCCTAMPTLWCPMTWARRCLPPPPAARNSSPCPARGTRRWTTPPPGPPRSPSSPARCRPADPAPCGPALGGLPWGNASGKPRR
jgi:pimeloyl-ACP methyl ester carboxylesterase